MSNFPKFCFSKDLAETTIWNQADDFSVKLINQK